ncbi:MAG: tRNA (N(6)-L-threonylcarbamoyladenosine(37)-C(2))-methylthiotransferase MtaB [Candidatus Spyradocola sp.]|jgi:threonylcarbamoyladenosine tRNA methylthiotransferase MtaB
MKRVAFMTLGCKTNQYDAEYMREQFLRAGYAPAEFDEIADVYVVSTCMVTATGERKSLKYVRQAARRNPQADIVVAGCVAQHEGEKLFLPGVRLVVGNARRREVVPLLERAQREGRALCAVEDLAGAPFEPLDVQANEGHTRAVMKIQEGCDNRCAYCIIPDVRGPIRSRALADVRAEAQALGEAGYREVVLTGIHLASYGRDFRDGTTLLDAIEAVCEAPGVARVRLGSLEPAWIDGPYAQRMAQSAKLCPQFHLSLQSGCDKVLGRMRRRYTTEQFRRAVRSLRESFPGCAITTDVITGFPGETEEDFRKTEDFCREIAFARMHVFPYSERPGTPAASFEGAVPIAEREARARRLIALGKELEAGYVRGLLGRTVEVMVEEDEEGYSREYVRVRVPGAREGEIVRAVVEDFEGLTAIGRPTA